MFYNLMTTNLRWRAGTNITLWDSQMLILIVNDHGEVSKTFHIYLLAERIRHIFLNIVTTFGHLLWEKNWTSVHIFWQIRCWISWQFWFHVDRPRNWGLVMNSTKNISFLMVTIDTYREFIVAALHLSFKLDGSTCCDVTWTQPLWHKQKLVNGRTWVALWFPYNKV